MPLVGVRSVLVLFVTAAVLAAISAPACQAAHNITAILSGRRDLAEFSRELTSTGLADDIDGRNTITVLAVDDAHMAALKARNLPRDTLRRVLSLHVLVDYYDEPKLRRLPGGSTEVSTLFQASGDAPGSAGMVEVAERRGGRVAFAPQDGGAGAVFYVRSLLQAPYNISVLQVSGVMSSPAAEAPASSPEDEPASGGLNFTDVMAKKGCGRFAGLVAATAGAAAAFEKQARDHDGGVTFFCPADKAVGAFEPAFKKLPAGDRLAVVLYHATLGHYSPQKLREDGGGDGMRMETLASLDGGKTTAGFAVRHAGDEVTLVSATRNTARVTRTLADADHVAVYMIDEVLVPFRFTGQASSPPGDGGDGHQTSGSAPAWPRRGWVASALVFVTLLAGFASG
ncbi:unnamed protein product [Urochloa decumbens]|uniref:FAS1 domain-containing protein n=1 Tax=Urochloa decumbens TaxID=240449 RepID=A0ABC9E9D6_9POAL